MFLLFYTWKNGAFNKRKHFLYGSSNICVVLILKIGDSNLFQGFTVIDAYETIKVARTLQDLCPNWTAIISEEKKDISTEKVRLRAGNYIWKTISSNQRNMFDYNFWSYWWMAGCYKSCWNL